MISRETTTNTVLHFTVICEIDKEQVGVQKIQQRLGDALLWLDGVGEVHVECDGELEPARE